MCSSDLRHWHGLDHARNGMDVATERRPFLVTRGGIPRTHQHARSTPPFPPHLPASTRHRGERRTAAAQTRQVLADAPTTPCAAGALPSAPPPPHGPVRRRGLTVVHLLCHRSLNAPPPSPPHEADTSPRHLPRPPRGHPIRSHPSTPRAPHPPPSLPTTHPCPNRSSTSTATPATDLPSPPRPWTNSSPEGHRSSIPSTQSLP